MVDSLHPSILRHFAGADDFVETTLWGEKNLPLLRRFMPYANGIPSHDTLCDVFAAIDPELFKACFLAWVDELRDPSLPELIAIDGKTSRRTHDRGEGRKPLHLVSAWAAGQRLVLGQQATEEKSNEITAIPLLLKKLDLTGAIVTIDAMGTHKDRPHHSRRRRALCAGTERQLARHPHRDGDAVQQTAVRPGIREP